MIECGLDGVEVIDSGCNNKIEVDEPVANWNSRRDAYLEHDIASKLQLDCVLHNILLPGSEGPVIQRKLDFTREGEGKNYIGSKLRFGIPGNKNGRLSGYRWRYFRLPPAHSVFLLKRLFTLSKVNKAISDP